MERRKIKIIIDILLLVFFILSATLIKEIVVFHIAVGSIFALLSVLHVIINRKWMISVTKSLGKGTLPGKTKRKYFLDLALIAVAFICILTGIPTIGHYFAGIENLQIFSNIHAASRIMLILIIIHVIQHMGQIKSYFKRARTRKPKSDVDYRDI